VLLPETGLREALTVAERIRGMVENARLNSMDGAAFGFTVSVGAAELQPGGGEEEIMHQADAALYQAKTSGRNRVLAAPA